MDPLENKIVKGNEVKQLDKVTEKKKTTLDVTPGPVVLNGEENTTTKQSAEKKADIGMLLESAKIIPVVIPKMASKKEQQQALSQQLENVHRTLEAQESAIYGQEMGEIHRKRLKDLSKSDKKKRLNEAKKRIDNAALLQEAEANLEKKPVRMGEVDEEVFVEQLKLFMEGSEEPLSMRKDADFAKNFEANMRKCKRAQRIKQWVTKAVDEGTFPSYMDLEKVQARIVQFEAIESYLEVQSALMKNPYYQYMAREDITYTNDQMERMESETTDQALKDYLQNVRKLRGLAYVRKEGMNSIREGAKNAGKRRAQILRSREEKRDVIAKLSESAMELETDPAYQEKNLDDTWRQEDYERSLAQFKKLNFKDLHFKDFRDMADHMKENNRMFRQTKEFERLLFIAVQKGQIPADNDMLELRAKIKAFKIVEDMTVQIQSYLIKNGEEAIEGMTWDEIAKECQSERNAFLDNEKYHVLPDLPVPGMDMTGFYKSMVKMVKDEHKNREKTIRTSYGITHPVKEEVEGPKGKTTKWHLGQISQEELRKRSADYQKNVFINEYMRGVHDDFQTSLDRCNNFARIYAKSKGAADTNPNFGRVLSRYVLGKNGAELKKVLDAHMFGTAQDKEALWKEVFAECEQVDHGEMDSTEDKIFLKNFAYKHRMSGIFANLSNGANFVKDPTLQKKMRAYYNVGCATLGRYGGITQALMGKSLRSLPLSDWEKIDGNLLNEFMLDLEEYENAQEDLVIDGQKITRDHAFGRDELSSVLLQFSNNKDFKFSSINNGYRKKGHAYINDSKMHIYEQFKREGLTHDTTPEELKEVGAFYTAFKTQTMAEQDAFNKAMQKQLKLTDAQMPADRTRIIFSMKNLRGDTLEKTAEHFKNILVKEKNPSKESLQGQAKSLETMFETMMSFDLSKFTFTSWKDLISKPDRFKECEAVCYMGMEMDKYIDQYKTLAENPQIACRMNPEHLKEIRARGELLKNTNVFFAFVQREEILNNPYLGKTGMSIDQIMNLPLQEITDRMDNAQKGKNPDPGAIKFWSDIYVMMGAVEGYGFNVNLKNMQEMQRIKQGCEGESKEAEILNILRRREQVFTDSDADVITVTIEDEQTFMQKFGKSFQTQKLSVTQRDELLKRQGSPLYVKQEHAAKIIKRRDAIQNESILARRGISLKSRLAVGEDMLIHLSAFMTKDKARNEDMAARYADEKKRSSLLRELTKDIMWFDTSIAHDEDSFADDVKKLEIMSQSARAYEALLKANPSFADELKNRGYGAAESDYDILRKKLNHMLAISDYYRARTLLMTDTYYIRHQNSELSANHDEKTTPEQRRVADLIRLVNECRRRISDDVLIRRNEELEAELQKHEQAAQQQAYLFGQPDLKKAEISHAAKADQEIIDYIRAAKAELKKKNKGDDFGAPDVAKFIYDSKSEHPFPDLVRYETEAVKNYIGMLKRSSGYQLTSSMMEEFKTTNPQKVKLSADLHKAFEGLKNFSLTNPKTGESLQFHTDPARLINSLVLSFGDGVPAEEILEMAEGFNVVNKFKLDLNNQEHFAYAKARWLESAKKLFYMEYNTMKRQENTYGTLPEQLPMGLFMLSLGEGSKEYAPRTLFGQDLTEITEEALCTVDGKSVSVGEYLVKEGLISKSELEDSLVKNTGYYQDVNHSYPQFCSGNTAKVIGGGMSHENIYDGEYNSLNMVADTRKKHSFGGPKLSFAEERKYWKAALDKGKITLFGGDHFDQNKRNKLDIYTTAERKEMKSTRKEDVERIRSYDQKILTKRDALLKDLQGKMGDAGQDQGVLKLLGKFIWFHPAMASDEAVSEEAQNEFLNMVKGFAGIGVEKKNQAARRKEIYGKLAEQMMDIRGFGTTVSDMRESGDNGLITADVRKEKNKIIYTSRLYRTELLSKAVDAVQDLMLQEENKDLIKDREFEDFRDIQLSITKNRIVRAIKKSPRYLALKDLGNRGRVEVDIKLNEMELVLYQINTFGEKALEGEMGEKIRSLLAEVNIPVYSKERLLKKQEGQKQVEDKQEEKPIEKKKNVEKPAKEKKEKKEDKKEEKKMEQPKGKKTEEKNVQPVAAQQVYIPHEKNASAPGELNHTAYENQGSGTNYCWACALNGLMNYKAGKKVSDLKTIKKHGFRPLTKVEAGINQNDKKDVKKYNEDIKTINSILKGNQASHPSVFGDYLFSKMADTAIRTASVARDPQKLGLCKQKFLETLSKQLQKGPVAMLRYGHFVLIEKLVNDNILMVRDSLSDHPDELQPDHNTVDDLFEKGGSQLDLVWLEDLKGHEAEYAAEYDLNYNADTKEFSKKGPAKQHFSGEAELLQRHGIEANSQNYDLEDVVMNAIYLPKKMGSLVQADGQVEILDNLIAEEGQEITTDSKKTKQKSKDGKSKPVAITKKSVEAFWKKASGKKDAHETAVIRKFAKMKKGKLPQGGLLERSLHRVIGLMGALGNSTVDESVEMLNYLGGDVTQMNAEQKTRRAVEFERLFRVMMEFNIDKLNYQNLTDLLKDDKQDVALMCSVMYDFPKEFLDDYEALIDNPDVFTALTKEQFQEVRARWHLFHTNNYKYNDIMPIIAEGSELGINIDELLTMTAEQIAGLSTKYHKESKTDKTKKPMEIFYTRATTIPFAIQKGVTPKSNAQETLQDIRTKTYKLPEKSEAPEAYGAIITRQVQRQRQAANKGKKKRRVELSPESVEAFSESLNAKRKEYLHAVFDKYEKQSKKSKERMGEGSIKERSIRRIVECLGVLGKNSVKESVETVTFLMGDPKRMTNEEKSKRALSFERLFKLVLDFDVKKMNYKNVEDLLQGDKQEVFLLGQPMWDLTKGDLADYEALINDPNVTTALTVEQFGEIKARWELLHSTSQIYSELPKRALQAKKLGLDINELLKMSEDEQQKLLNSEKQNALKQGRLVELVVMVNIVKQTLKPGDDVERLLQDIRINTFHLQENSQVADAQKAINTRLAKKK